MANDLNQVTMIGRLTRDPELRQIGSGTSVCSFGIANNRAYVSNGEKKEEVSFFNCTAWGRLGEIINQYCQKGKQIAISGRLRQNSYDNQEGKKVSTVEIVVENMQLLGSRNETGDFSGSSNQGSSSNFSRQSGNQSDQGFGSQQGNPSPAFNSSFNQGPDNYESGSDDDIPF